MYTNYSDSFSDSNQFLVQVQRLLTERRLDKFKQVSFSFYLNFEHRHQALAVTELLTAKGFSVVMEEEYQANKWSCWCNKSITPVPLKLEEMGQGILSVIREGNGELKRWETNPYNSGQELGQLLAALEHQYIESQADAA